MWVYSYTREVEGYEVGFYDPRGDWIVCDTFADEADARKLVNFLNGGNGK